MFCIKAPRLTTPFFSFVLSATLALTTSAQTPGKQRLYRHVPTELANLQPAGPLSTTSNLQLAITLPLRNTAALSNLLSEIYDPASPNYHHYLTPRQFTAQFGPTTHDYQEVIKFARANGLRVTTQYPNRLVLDVSGPVSNIERAFHTSLQTYQHPTQNRVFYAPAIEPSVDLAVPIVHVDGLDNFSPPRPHLQTVRPATPNPRPSPFLGAGPSGSYMGGDFRAAYVPDTTLSGSGQAVGLLEFDGYAASDITYYENKANLPNVQLQNVLIDGATGTPSGSGGEVEVSLDIEVAVSMAPGLSKIIVYEGTSSFVDIFNRMASDNQAKQLSCSWYIPGGPAQPAADQIFQQMAAQGQSFFNASGDSDAYTGLISFPGDTPYITQVGGTTLTNSGPRGSWVSEAVWNWGNEFGPQYDGIGSSGGISTQYPIPSYQTNISMTVNHGSTTMRNTPDVAMTADNVYVRADGVNYIVGGTSCAAPLWAGFSGLVNQEAVASGHAPVGFINPLVDAIGTAQKYGSAFHDITTGNNKWSGSPNQFSAVAGYDLCTGWGTPAGQRLIDALANPEALVITPGSGFTSIGGVGGPFSVTSQILSLTNSGTNMLTWSLVNTSAWLSASQNGGALSPGGLATLVTFSLNTTASNLPVGNYSATVWFTNLNDNFGQSRQFILNVISPPAIANQPTNQAVLDGDTAAFSAGVTGGAPLSYQWQFNGTNLADGGNISGSGTTTLTISSASISNVGAYDLVATNYAGVTVSSNALLSLIPSAPIITLQPTNETVGIHQTALFSVAAVGTKPFTYQWTFNTTNIDGATNATLVLTNAQFSQAGTYSVTVSNIYGVADSSNALLTVLPCDPDPAGIVAWWRAEGNASDSIGTNNGTILGTVGFVPGEVGQAFSFDGFSGYVSVTDAPPLDFSNRMTVELWVKANSQSPNPDWEGIVCKGNTSWRLQATTFTNTVTFSATGLSPQDLFGTRNINDGQWHHLAGVYDGSTMYLYVDGTLDVSQAATGIIAQNNVPLAIGNNNQPTPGHNYMFNGLVDEVSLYDRALSASEIAAIYNIGSVGKCFTPAPPSIETEPTNETALAGGTAAFSVIASGTPPLYYQWYFDGTNIPGATNATLILNDVQSSQAGNYTVSVSSPYGSTNSTAASLTVNPLPPCDPDLSGLVNWWRAEGNALDSIGTNNGTLEGTAAFTSGEVGQAFSLDGTSGYVSIPDSPSLDSFSNAMTIELWVKSANPGNNADWEGLVTKGNDAWRLMATTFANTVYVAFDGASPSDLTGTRNINDGQWHHVAATYNGSTMALYVDGTLDVSQPATGTLVQDSFPLYLGGDANPPAGHSYLFDGLLDEVSIYNRALTASEIQEIYLVGSAGKCVPTSPPSIVTEPVNQTNLVGTTATFSVVASGTQPLSYQWTFNATNIIGATNPTLVLTDVQLAQAGNYAVSITNLYGSTNSTTATLTVNSEVSCDQPPAGITDWWRAEGNALDSIGTNNGTPIGTVAYTNGEVGQAFSFNGSSGYISVPDAPSLNFSNSMTVEFWVKANSQSPNSDWEGIVCKGNRSYRMQATSGARTATFSATGLSPQDLFGTRNINDGQWHHVAGVYDGSTMYLYVDGTLDVSQAATGTIAQTNIPLAIGNNNQPTPGHNYMFNGLVDEVSLYSRALSSNEIAAIYYAGSDGKCVPTPPFITSEPTNQIVVVGGTATFSVTAGGSPVLTYQWYNGSGSISGATNSTLTLSNVQLNQAGSYYVAVSNPYGSTNSATATLTVNSGPSCEPPPAGLVDWWRAEGDATDSIGTNNGTLEGTATFTSGEVGQAFSLDGSSGYVSIPDSPSLDSFSNAMTIELWVKSANLGNNADWEGLVTKGNDAWRLMATTFANTVYVAFDGANPPDLSGTRNINDGQWHHVAATYNGSTMALYVDGTLDASQPATGTLVQNSFPVYLGGDANPPAGHSYLFDGLLDEVSLYNRALSSNEIAAIYASGHEGKCYTPTPPAITSEPVSQTNFIGTTASFSVTATGTQPLGYQWTFNTTNIVGATNPTLILTNVQLAQAGNYAVTVTNLYGSTSSTTATLTVNSLPSCDPPPAGLVDWWRAEGDATDSIGTNNGTLEGTAAFTSGEVGQAFSLDGTSGYVSIPDSPSLDSFSNAMTIELWVKSANLGNNADWEGLVTKGNDAWRLMATTFANTVYVAFDGANPPDLSGTRNINDGQWHHVAATYNGSTMALYVDGTLDASQPATGTLVQNSFPVYLGGDANPPAGHSYLFDGLLDEVSIYNRALTASEIQQIYLVGSGGKCVPAVPPTILAEPVNETNFVGTTASLSVTAVGTQPLNYQWTFDTTIIVGATNSTLILTNVQLNEAGNYAVSISNAYGSTNSATATLTVNPVPSCDPDPAGLVDWWRAEGNALDSIGTNNGTLEGTAAFTSGEVGQAFSLDGTSGYVSIPDSPSLDSFSNAMTIELWVKSANLGNNADWEGLVTKGNDAWRLMATTFANTVYVAFDGANPPDLSGTRNINDGQWHHVAATYNGSTMALYVDGTLDASQPATGTLVQNSFPVYLGGDANPPIGHSYLFDGLLDEVSLYNRALSSNEIAAIYAAGPGGKCPVGIPPAIITQPTNQAVAVGGTASFSVFATGSAPLSYQWFNGSGSIGGATNSALTLSNVQSSQAGAYYVTVSNPYGSTNSTSATLTVTNPPPSCDPAPNGLVAWWRAEGDGNDSIDSNNGTLLGGLGFTNGEVGTAFNFVNDTQGVQINASPTLAVQSITIECWINPVDVSDFRPIVEYGADTGLDPVQFIYGWNEHGTSPGAVFGLFRDINGGGLAVNSPANILPTGQWSHVALTYDYATRTGNLYLNGTNVGSSVYATNLNLQTSLPVHIGYRPDTSGEGRAGTRHLGGLDEVSVYDRALSQSEIQAIYNAGSAGKCFTPVPPSIVTQPTNQTVVVGSTATFSVVAAGSPTLSYQWFNGSGSLGVATNSTLTLSNVQSSQAGGYYVTVSNPYGSTNSATATLTVTNPPSCTPAPSGLVAWWKAESNFLDSSTFGNNGTQQGITGFAAGEVGAAFNFTNGTEGVRVDGSSSLTVSNITIEGWINPSYVDNYGPIVEYGSDTNNQLSPIQMELGWSEVGTRPGALFGIFRTGPGASFQMNSPANLIPKNQWSHVAMTFDYASQTANLYFDGTFVSSASYPGPGMFNPATNMAVYIGYRSSGSGEALAGTRFQGKMDEFSIYSRALSAQEIAAIYNAGSAGKCFTPVPPSIVTQPTNQTVVVGGAATFSVVAAGSPTLSYQWFNGSGSLTGATNSTLTLSNVQLNQAGSYYVDVSNAYGSTNSSSATLTVTNPPPSCTPAPSGIISWWPAEGNANDIIGTNNGTPVGALSYANGEVGQAFVFDGSSSYIPLAPSPSLQVGSGPGLTIECWTIPAINAVGPIVEWDSSSSDGLQLWVDNGPHFFANLKDTSGVAHTLVSADGVVNHTSFQHVAVTYDRASGNAFMYLNGTVIASANFGNITPATTYPAYHVNIGRRTGQLNGLNDTFHGLVDELSVYGRALSQSEIQAIYNAGSAGKCFTPVPPTIVTQPTNQTVVAGGTATFSVVAAGSPTLNYQWFSGSGSIAGATNSTLTLSNVQLSQSGTSYYVTVSNLYGSTNSASATLTVNPAPPCTPAPSGIISWWPAEGNANDIIGTNNGTPVGALSYANGEVGQAFVFDGSSSYIPLAPSPSLQIGSGPGLTIECWTIPAINAVGPIVEWDSSSSDGLQLWVDNGPHFFANLKDTSGVAHTLVSADGVVNHTTFQHLAITYDRASGNAFMYLNGTVIASANFGNITPATTYPAYHVNIGRRTGQSNGLNDTFHGLVDELSVYGRALSQSEIQAIYNAGAAGKCLPPPPVNPPVILSLNPASGAPGTTVNITGLNFDPTPGNNVVYFGAVQAVVSQASESNLVVTVPRGATFAPVTETVHNLTAYSSTPFLATFPGGSPLSSSSLSNRFNLNAGSYTYGVAVGDLDGDGKPDLVVANAGDSSIWIYRNISTNGSLTVASFAAPVVLHAGAVTSIVPSNPILADLDGDGRLDIVFPNYGEGTVSVFQNLSTPGSLTTNSFAPRVDYAVGGNPAAIAVSDLDGDGKPEIVAADIRGTNVSVLRNLSTGGLLTSNSFAAPQNFAAPASPHMVVAADVDGDGKFDLVTANASSSANGVSVFRNTSTPGSISFAPRVDLAAPSAEETVAVGDIDGDGKQDLIVGSYTSSTFSVYRNIGAPGSVSSNTFAAPVTFAAGGPIHEGGIALGDLDGDGRPDVGIVDQNSGHLYLYRNLSTPGSFATGSLAAPVTFVSGFNSAMLAIVDLNGDGRPDIFIGNTYGNNITVWENAVPISQTYSFVWSQIPSPRFVNTPFTVTIQAMLTNGVYTNFSGSVTLTSTNGIGVTPAISGNFVQGTWTGMVQVSQTASNLVLQAVDSLGQSGTANPINIMALPMLATGVTSNSLSLTWPASPSGFILETAPDLSGPWVPANGSAVQFDGQYSQQVQLNGTNAFYRLRFPGP